ncbi:MAG: magnesium transporter CorA family protein [Patescibacteria group bacterium]
MLTTYFRTIKDDTLKSLSEWRSGVWIHAEMPTEIELQQLVSELGVDETILEDATDFFEVPRLERSDGVTYFFTRYPYEQSAEDAETAPLLIAVGESFVLTVSQYPVPQFEPFTSGTRVVHTTQKTKLFIQLMQVLTSSYERQLIRLRRAVHKDRAKLRKIGNREIVRFVEYEHKLNDMIAAVLPTNTALQQVLGGGYIQIYDDDRELVEDLRIDNAQVVDSARTLLKTIQNVRSAAEAILANNLNNRIKTLTVLTVLLTVPTIVSSLFGMNVALPLEGTPYAFLYIVLFVSLVVALMVWYFKRHEWF